MPGRYGNVQQTTLGLKIVKILPQEHLILIKGAVPGRNGGLISIKKSNR